jgi:hypothetical protein
MELVGRSNGGRDPRGRWPKGVSGNPEGAAVAPSPVTKLLKLFADELSSDENAPKLRAALQKWVQEDPVAALLAFVDRVPKEVRTAIMARWLSPDERAGLVKKFEVSGDETARQVDLVHRALTRVADEARGRRPGRE